MINKEIDRTFDLLVKGADIELITTGNDIDSWRRNSKLAKLWI